MTIKLDQKWLSEKKSFEILEDGLKIIQIKVSTSYDYFVPFEYIPTKYREFNKSYPLLFTIPAFFLVVILFLLPKLTIQDFIANISNDDVQLILLFIAFIIGSIISFFLTKKSYTIFESENYRIILFKNKPSEKIFKEFINNLINARNIYMQDHYLKNKNQDSVVDELFKLNQLLNNNIINEDEFIKLKKRIISEDEDIDKIGFNN